MINTRRVSRPDGGEEIVRILDDQLLNTWRRDNPLAWLRYGPGRTSLGEPGRTEAPAAHKGRELPRGWDPDIAGGNPVDRA